MKHRCWLARAWVLNCLYRGERANGARGSNHGIILKFGHFSSGRKVASCFSSLLTCTRLLCVCVFIRTRSRSARRSSRSSALRRSATEAPSPRRTAGQALTGSASTRERPVQEDAVPHEDVMVCDAGLGQGRHCTRENAVFVRKSRFLLENHKFPRLRPATSLVL